MVGYKNREGMTILFGAILWGVIIAMLLYLTLLTGFRRECFRMSLCLSLFVFTVFIYLGMFLDLIIHTCFKRLEDIIPRRLDSTPLKWRTAPAQLAILWLLFVLGMASVSLRAALRQQWLTLCVLLTVLAIGNLIFMGVKTALNIRAYSKRLEKLISTCGN